MRGRRNERRQKPRKVLAIAAGDGIRPLDPRTETRRARRGLGPDDHDRGH